MRDLRIRSDSTPVIPLSPANQSSPTVPPSPASAPSSPAAAALIPAGVRAGTTVASREPGPGPELALTPARELTSEPETAPISGTEQTPEPILCRHCGRTASNGLVCEGYCVADSGY